MRSIRLKTFTAATALAAIAACADNPTTGPGATTEPPPAITQHLDAPLAIVSCTATTTSLSITCGSPSTAKSGGRDAVLIGGQNQFVTLTSSNVAYNSGTGLFTFDVSVQNLIPQPLATTDGTTPEANGVRVFFSSGPTVTAGTGTASIIPDNFATFTAPAQAYYEYSGSALGGDGILSQNETSSSKPWTLVIPSTATSFTFLLYVWADVQFPNGYIDVTPTRDTLSTGEGQALVATVRNYLGEAVPGAVVSWNSSDSTIASVDGAGNVTGAGVGAANITATSGLRSGIARINVCPALAVGGSYTASMPAASELCFAGGASGAEYTYMPVNLSTSSALSLTVVGSGIQAVTGPPSPNLIPSGNMMLATDGKPALALGFEATPESDIRFLHSDAPQIRSAFANRASRIKRGSIRPDGKYVVAASAPTVGDSLNINTNAACSGSPSVRRGVIRSISNHLIVVADTANPAGGFTTAQYDSIAFEFDSIAWPVDSANFGITTDTDNNGHVIAFFTRAVNELSPPASSAVVLGFFASKDVFSNDPVDGCSNSNQGEIFYMLVPDPTGAVNSNVRPVSFVRGYTTGTLGHEFQHLTNAFRRAYVTGASAFEEGWLNEGLSHIAEELMFYRMSVGLAPRGNIQLSTLTTGPNASRRVAAFNTYANQNYGRLRSWLQRPDTAGAFNPNANSLAVRGAIWAYLRYASDRNNIGDVPFFYGLANSNLEGKANIQNAIGADPNNWLRDFTNAMYADDNSFAVAAQYQNPSWNYRSIYGELGGFPLLPRPLTNGVGLTLSYRPGGGTAYTRFGVPASAFAGVTALSGGVPPASPYALIVTRTK
jgi:hypothetical protein